MMVIDWIYALYLIIIINSFGFAFLVLKSFLQLKQNDKVIGKTTSNYMLINRQKKRIDDIEAYLFEGVPETKATAGEAEQLLSSLPFLPDTLEEAIEKYGLKELNNPIFRPTAEKIYKQIKDKMTQQGTSESEGNVGY